MKESVSACISPGYTGSSVTLSVCPLRLSSYQTVADDFQDCTNTEPKPNSYQCITMGCYFREKKMYIVSRERQLIVPSMMFVILRDNISC